MTCPAGCMQPQTDSGNGSNQVPNLAWKIVGPIASVIGIIASCAGYLRRRRSVTGARSWGRAQVRRKTLQALGLSDDENVRICT